jgi:hypothetical protein
MIVSGLAWEIAILGVTIGGTIIFALYNIWREIEERNNGGKSNRRRKMYQ